MDHGKGELLMKRNRTLGCPNCKTEKSSLVWNINDFQAFNDLELVSKFGLKTELFRCRECGTKYIRVNNGHLYHLLSGATEKFFFDFFDRQNVLSKENNKVIAKVGSPMEIDDFPVRVKTKDGVLIPYAVIMRRDPIWPIGLDLASVRLLSEIEEVSSSDEAMTLEQRTAAYKAPEIRMGVAPIWLIRNGQEYMTEYGQYFIPAKYGSPSEFSIATSISGAKPRFDSVEVTYFIGPT